MKRRIWPVIAIAALTGFGGFALLQQRQAGILLAAKVELLRAENVEIGRLRAENRRLALQQVSAVELENLRADHAALPRLRGEIDELKRGLPSSVP